MDKNLLVKTYTGKMLSIVKPTNPQMVPKAAWWLGTEDRMLVSYPEMRYTDLY